MKRKLTESQQAERSAEIDRLREALASIELIGKRACHDAPCVCALCMMENIARSALAKNYHKAVAQ